MEPVLLQPDRAVTDGGVLRILAPEAAVLVEADRIVAVGEQASATAPPRARILPLRGTLLPGLIDLQVNGAGGRSVEEAAPDALNEIALAVRAGGAGSFLPTLISAPMEQMLEQTAAVADWIEKWVGAGARPLGIHLEGPFLEVPGAHEAACLVDPTPERVQALIDAARGQLKLVTLAPGRPGSAEATARFCAAGVTVSIGHASSEEQFDACVEAGARMATHLFNAMGSVHHRKPGIAGRCLAESRLSCSLITDGAHVHPTMVLNAFRCLTAERMVLVTDCMAAAGMADGEFSLGSSRVKLADGVVRNADGRLAGSAILMQDAVRGLLDFVPSAGPAEVAALAARNPARLLGEQALGVIAPGARAEFALLDEQGLVSAVDLSAATGVGG